MCRALVVVGWFSFESGQYIRVFFMLGVCVCVCYCRVGLRGGGGGGVTFVTTPSHLRWRQRKHFVCSVYAQLDRRPAGRPSTMAAVAVVASVV